MAAATVTRQVLSGAEEDAVIRLRALTQTMVARGEPPFKRLTRRFLELCSAAKSAATEEQVQAAHEAFLREVSMMELQVERHTAIAAANLREQQGYALKQEQLAAQIEQAKQDILLQQVELAEARVARQHMEEYEVLRHIVATHPARATTSQEISRVKQDISRISAERDRAAALMQKRRQQFSLLFYVIEELQRLDDSTEEAPTQATTQAMEVDS